MKYKLKEIFDLQMGKTPSRHNSEYWSEDGFKWISIADLSGDNKYITTTKECISKKAVEESGIKVIPANTVIMSFKLSLGKTAIVAEDMYSNEAIMAFHDRQVIDILPEYIFYLFKYKDWDRCSNKAVKGKTLNKAILSEEEIEICSLKEQRAIVDVLDSLSNVIEKRSEELSALDTLIKARFVEMFGDPIENQYFFEESNLKDISVGGLTYGSTSAAIPYDGETRYVRITDITDKGELGLDIKSPDSIDEKYLLNDGDILFARSGATVGKTLRFKERYGRCIYAGFLLRLVPDRTKVNPDYVFSFTKSPYYENFIKKTQRVVAQPNINAREYGELKILVPPLELQNQFADFVQQVDKSKVAVQKSLDEAQLLFDSLMQEYFG